MGSVAPDPLASSGTIEVATPEPLELTDTIEVASPDPLALSGAIEMAETDLLDDEKKFSTPKQQESGLWRCVAAYTKYMLTRIMVHMQV